MQSKTVEPTQNTYNQPPTPPQMPQAGPMGPPMPGMPMPGMMPMPPRKKKSWKDVFMKTYGIGMHASLKRDELTLPKWMVGKPVLFFIIAIAACSIVFGYAMPMQIAVVTCLSVVLFFYGSESVLKQWKRLKEKTFIKNVFIYALAIRLVWMLFSYFYLNEAIYGKKDGVGDDTGWYMWFSKGIADWIMGNQAISFSELMEKYSSAIDDVGYPTWLAIEYLLSFETSDVFFPLLTKAFLGAYCAVCIYHIAIRHFDEGTARLASVFILFNPYLLYWGVCMLKETEMVFLCCMSVDLIDRTLSSGDKLTFRGLLPGVVMAMLLFFFRSALAIAIFLSVFMHIVFVSNKVLSVGKKIVAGLLIGAALLVGLGDRLRTQSEKIVDTVQADTQGKNMEWRSKRSGGNAFAKYAGATVFAPLIFTIPFPTLNIAHEGQIQQLELSGAYYIKNILSFFVIYVMVLFLASGEWRKHVFILAYTLGYLVVLVLSVFAQSGRFHMPIMPMLFLFAAFGIQVAKGNVHIRRGFNIVLIVEILLCLAWNWFKLKGRGMI